MGSILRLTCSRHNYALILAVVLTKSSRETGQSLRDTTCERPPIRSFSSHSYYRHHQHVSLKQFDTLDRDLYVWNLERVLHSAAISPPMFILHLSETPRLLGGVEIVTYADHGMILALEHSICEISEIPYIIPTTNCLKLLGVIFDLQDHTVCNKIRRWHKLTSYKAIGLSVIVYAAPVFTSYVSEIRW